MTFQVNSTNWLELPREVRDQLVKLFNIPKTGHSRVYGSRVLSDGYTEKDLQSISIGKINAFLGTEFEEIDILKAFNQLVNKLTESNGTESDTNKSANTGTNTGTVSSTGAGAESSGGIKEDSESVGGTAPSSTIQTRSKASRRGEDERTSS